MIPSRYEYYMRRATEHRTLARKACQDDAKLMHDKLVGAYVELARKYRLKQIVSIKAG